MSKMLEDARDELQDRWGHSEFRPAQAQVLEHVFEGTDVLAVLPTGYGKSVTFQIPALLADGCAIVISPLIALMKDQVDDCEDRDIDATYINSHVDEGRARDRLEGFVEGRYKLLYVAPERMRNRNFMAALSKAAVSYLVVDEAHCHPAGTRVTMADGSYKFIEDVLEGDLVLTWPGGEQGLCAQRVQEHQVKFVGRRRLLKIKTPLSNLVLTDDHPVYVVGKGYIDAGDVKEGDSVLCALPQPVETESDQGESAVLQQRPATRKRGGRRTA